MKIFHIPECDTGSGSSTGPHDARLTVNDGSQCHLEILKMIIKSSLHENFKHIGFVGHNANNIISFNILQRLLGDIMTQ